jgi:orotidine-5'-phosphate decarboxylase
METFVDRLQAAMLEKQSVLCVGLDPRPAFIPPQLVSWAKEKWKGDPWQAMANVYKAFNEITIDAVSLYAPAVKPNIAFCSGGHWLTWALEQTIQYARNRGLLVVLDGKFNDGGDSAKAYANAYIGEMEYFDNTSLVAPMRSDAVTVNGYIDEACVSHFVKASQENGTGFFVVDKTSFNPNSRIEQLRTESGLKVWERLAFFVEEWGRAVMGGNGYSNVGVVMGATYPEDASRMRNILPNNVFLNPGYGTQGATADDVAVSFNEDGFGCLPVSASAIMAAWCKDGGRFKCDPKDFATAAANAAEYARDDLNAALRRAGKCAW